MNIRPRQVILYRNVFYSRVSTAVVLTLCLSFLLQPVERVFASEVAQVQLENSTAIINLAVDAGLSNNSPDLVEDVARAELVEEMVSEAGSVEPNSDLTTEIATTADEASGDTDGGTLDTPEETSTTTEFTEQEIQEMINPEDELPETQLIESAIISTTTAEIPVAVSTVNSDAVMQFNRNDCVTVEDGSFYCQSKREETEQGTDGMYALQDRDGDLEIFLQKNGELSQLTFNTVDDAAPVFDAKSNTIVWHRLVDERYQIISYNLDTSSEVQLTADNVNNMEPSRSGNYTVWQRWNDTNWDIAFYDGTETTFLTDNHEHDIAPNVKGDLVMWNRLSGHNTQTIELFDIVTQEFTTITDEEGGALSNPRMVLVYETEFANGDVVTKGFDIETGEVTPLANDPADLPEELPEPDATGETRALVQPKNLVKEDSEFGEDMYPGIDGPDTGATTTSNSMTPEPGDLHIASSSPSITDSVTNMGSATSSVSDMTLDLTPPHTEHIDIPPDLIVPPYVLDVQTKTVETGQ